MVLTIRANHGGVLFGIFLLSFMASSDANTKTLQGFEVKLIPRHSKQSPFYQANLTLKERFQQMEDISDARAYYLQSRRDMVHTNASRLEAIPQPHLILSGAYYVVQLAVGEKNPIIFYLLLDTGSDITWIQASDCANCFYIKGGSFDYRKSRSFVPLPCKETACHTRSCDQSHYCYYSINYESAASSGFFGSDIFKFQSDQLETDYNIRLLFGLGNNNYVSFGDNVGKNNIAGIFGLGNGSYSFQNQLDATNPSPSHSLARFSYCLPALGAAETDTMLRFGNNAYIPTDLPVQTTHLMSGPVRELYYLNCTGMSVAGMKFPLPPDTFSIKNQDGGMVIDSGSPYTTIVQIAYDRLTRALKRYFDKFNMKPWDKPASVTHLCYDRPPGFEEYPYITFHFQDADWNIESPAAFFVYEEYFCLAMKPVPNGKLSILGSMLQSDTWFVYDTYHNQLSFSAEGCV